MSTQTLADMATDELIRSLTPEIILQIQQDAAKKMQRWKDIALLYENDGTGPEWYDEYHAWEIDEYFQDILCKGNPQLLADLLKYRNLRIDEQHRDLNVITRGGLNESQRYLVAAVCVVVDKLTYDQAVECLQNVQSDKYDKAEFESVLKEMRSTIDTSPLDY